MTKEEIEVKELEIKLEQLKIIKQEQLHNFRMEEFRIKKEIAKLYHPKKKVQLNKQEDKKWKH